jgi:hypothetical protein
MTRRELGLCWAVLAFLGALVYLPHVLHGGFYSDDWWNAASTLYRPGGTNLANAFDFYAEKLTLGRPVIDLLLPLRFIVFETHVKLVLVASVGLAVLAAMLTYAILRVLSVPWQHSLLLAALTIVYPWFDSTRVWDAANIQTVAIVFAAAGFWLALIGLSRRSWALHLGAALLYLLSVLTYEVTAPVIAAAGIVYVARCGWRRGRGPWAADLAVVAAAAVWNGIHTPKSISGPAGALDHLLEMVPRGGELLARSLSPLGSHPHTTLVLLVLAAILGIGLGAYLLVPTLRSPGWGLGNWLLLAAAGLLVAALGWAIFIPAHPYYTPSIFGVTNRVNGVAGFGLILVVYAAFGVIGSLIGELAGRRSAVTLAVTLGLGVSLGAAYVHVLERHIGLWRDAYEMELAGLNGLREIFPRLPHGTTLFVSGYPANVTPGVPIFATTWDLRGAVQVTYADYTVRAYPVTEEVEFRCRARGMVPSGGEEVEPLAPYGTARLVDLETGRHLTPRDRSQCLAARPRFEPGPLYLASAY